MAYNNRLDDDVLDDQSTEHKAVAFPEDIESTMDDDFATLIVSYDNPVLALLETDEEVDLAQFEQMEMNAFQKKCLDLFKVWSIMKENMMKSGTHDSDPYNFVEVAMRGFMGLTPISVFYFYKWCDKHPDIDSVFQPFMNDTLKGNSITLGTCDDDMSPSTHYARPTHPNKQETTVVVACHLYVDAVCLVVTREVGLEVVELFLLLCCDCHMVAIKNCNTFCHDTISANR